MHLIPRAAQLADYAHRGQLRKYTGRPYIEHPMRVAGRVCLYSEDDECVAAAWLHDTIEDCALPYRIIAEYCGEPVASLVLDLTSASKRRGHDHLSREERKRIDREHLVKCRSTVQIIKAFDRIDNLRDMDAAPEDFRKLYAEESLLLCKAMALLPWDVSSELTAAAERLKAL